MKVFISWSGPQSNYIAQALRNWLLDVIPHLSPWMSGVDINAGERWGNKLWDELQDSQFGVVCLTAENIQAPWLHYEAGALAKAVDRRVCPYLYEIDPSVVKGPLSEFQWKQANEKGTKELVESIHDTCNTLTQKSLRPGQLDKAFNTWWPGFDKKLKDVPQSPTAPRREIQEMVEELLEIGRSLAREATRTKEEERRIILKILAERERTVPLEEERRGILEILAERKRTVPPEEERRGILEILAERKRTVPPEEEGDV